MAEPIRKPEPEPEPQRETSIIGKPFRRVDGRAKVTGATKFADDLAFPRTAYVRLVRSTQPHALIRFIDFSEAEKVPGFLGFLTGKETPIPFGILPVSQDEHALCPDKVRFVGDPVAAVAATTEDAAYEAAFKVKVEYEPLSTISSIEEAIATPEPRIHDYGDHGNLHKVVSMTFGEVEKGFASADEIFEDTFYYEGNTHLPMEQHSAVAVPEDDDRVTLYSSSQTPHYVHRALQTVTYKMPAYEFQGVRCFTNKPPCGPKRGHGTPQPRFGFEVHLDKIAVKLGVNPADLRLNMLAEPDSITANWLKIGSMGLRRCIEAVVEGSGFRERWGRLPEGRGLGLSCGSYLCGAGLPIYWNHMPQSGVMLKLDRSGGVAVFCGESEIGQGSDSILAAVVAEVLGVALSDIRLCVADTDLTPVDLGYYSSRVPLMVGNAALQAAERAREMISKAVSEQLEIPESRLVFAERRVFDAQDPEKGLSSQAAVLATAARS